MEKELLNKTGKPIQRKDSDDRFQTMISDIKEIIAVGREQAYNAVNKASVLTYWQIGKRIVEQEQNGENRAEYGKALMDTLSYELTAEYGTNYSKRNLQYFRKFYLYFPDEQIVNACVHNLSCLSIKLQICSEENTLQRKTQLREIFL